MASGKDNESPPWIAACHDHGVFLHAIDGDGLSKLSSDHTNAQSWQRIGDCRINLLAPGGCLVAFLASKN